MQEHDDKWSAGETYEQFMGRWSRDLATEFVAWIGCRRGQDWLDLGCGTGSLTRAILAQAEPRSVTACDPAIELLGFARETIEDPRVSFFPAGADDFPFPREGYGSIASLLALNFFPSIADALQRMRTASRAHALISACVWDYSEGMQFLRYFWDAAATVHPDARAMDEGNRFQVCRPENLQKAFHDAGLTDIRCDGLTIKTRFSSFEDYWTPFVGGTGPAPAFVDKLTADEQEILRSRLRASLPIDGSGIQLTARAWAISGINLSA